MHRSLSTLSIILATTATPLAAQTVPVKLPVTSKPVNLHVAMPTLCDETIVRAVAMWNAQTVKFKY